MSRKQTSGGVRLLPTMMVTLAALLGLKAVAVAQGAGDHAPAAPAQPPAPAQPAQANAQQCDNPSFAEMAGLSQSEVQVLQALGARRERLDQRAAAMQTGGDLMAAAERRIEQRLAELRRLETEVSGLLGQLDEAQEQRMAGLVDVYQRMRAKDAATVFDTLDEPTLLQVASRMRQQNLAEVMGRMQPARARRLTQMLAERAYPTDAETLL
ncbi:MAG: MotE family protein, partial [Hyphomonadaceae bacterium]